ncbi:beta-L-arabinofuranosidase domain-containing protein [Micromonosporaceae bacterium Da 78-11]
MTPGKAALRELPLGAIRPTGWLRDQLQLQATGITGRLPEVWPDVGPDNAWLGGTGDDWERGPYYLDGLLPLAYLLDDETLKATAQQWVEAILAGQGADGQFGPASNQDWWPRMVALKVLTQHADATSDTRVEPFLARYFRFQMQELPNRPLYSWGRVRGADNILSVLWLYDRTGESWLLDLARLLREQTADWATFILHHLPPGAAPTFKLLTHGPNIAMGLKTPAVNYLLDGDTTHHTTTVEMFAGLERLHGLVHGVFSGDEWLAGRAATQGVETCQVVELMYTIEQIARIAGDGRYGDYLEEVAYNLLAAANDPHMLAHQYHQQANQVLVSVAQRDWSFSGDDANVFGLEPHFGCCTANLHQAWPKLTRSLWMLDQQDALTAVAYAPCTVTADVRGTNVRLEVQTHYPFEETVAIRVDVAAPTTLALQLRIPAWCTEPVLEVAGEKVDASPDATGYAAIERTWTDGDVVKLTLPMRVRTIPRDKDAVGVRLGPLVMALRIAENWHPVPDAPGLGEWEITPRKAWNIGLWTGQPGGPEGWPVTRHDVATVPFTARRPPVVVHVRGAAVPHWRMHHNSAGPVPQSPIPSALPMDRYQLVPYGSARLRIAEFPTVVPTPGSTQDAWSSTSQWNTAPADAEQVSARLPSTYQ